MGRKRTLLLLFGLCLSVRAQEAAEQKAGAGMEEGLPTVEKPWSLTLKTGVGWDSNPGLFAPNFDIASGDRQDERIYSEISFSYKVYRKERTTLEIGYQGYKEWYNHRDEFALEAHTFPIKYRVDYADWGYALGFYFTYLEMDGDGVLREYRLSPSVYWVQNPTTIAMLYMNLFYRDYLHARDFNGSEWDIGLMEQFELASDTYLRFFCEPGYVDARDNDFRYWRLYLGASLSVPLLEDVDATISLGNEIRSYSHQDDIEGVSRNDNRWIGTVLIRKQVTAHLSLALKYEWMNRGSNIPGFRYRRETLGLEAILEF